MKKGGGNTVWSPKPSPVGGLTFFGGYVYHPIPTPGTHTPSRRGDFWIFSLANECLFWSKHTHHPCKRVHWCFGFFLLPTRIILTPASCHLHQRLNVTKCGKALQCVLITKLLKNDRIPHPALRTWSLTDICQLVGESPPIELFSSSFEI